MIDKLKSYYFNLKYYSARIARFFLITFMLINSMITISYKHFSRYAFDLLLLSGGVFLLITGSYVDLTSPIQLLIFKMVAISAGLLHAHLAGKMLFPSVDWDSTILAGKHYARIGLYIIVPLSYTFAG